MVEHPVTRDSLKRFAAGAATREEGQLIAAHLLKGCTACAQVLRDLGRGKASHDAYSRALDQFERGLKADEVDMLEEALTRR